MRVYFHGGPLNGQLQEIPDGRDRWDIYVGPSLSTCFTSPISGDAPIPPPAPPRVVTYVPSGDFMLRFRLRTQLGLALLGGNVFVPRNTVDADSMPANHRWN